MLKIILLGMCVGTVINATFWLNLKSRWKLLSYLIFFITTTAMFSFLFHYYGKYPVFFLTGSIECPFILIMIMIFHQGNPWRGYLFCWLNSQINNIFLSFYSLLLGTQKTQRILTADGSCRETVLFLAACYVFALVAAGITRLYMDYLDQKDRFVYKLSFVLSWEVGMAQMLFKRQANLSQNHIIQYSIYEAVAVIGVFLTVLYIYYGITLRDLHRQQLELENVIQLRPHAQDISGSIGTYHDQDAGRSGSYPIDSLLSLYRERAKQLEWIFLIRILDFQPSHRCIGFITAKLDHILSLVFSATEPDSFKTPVIYLNIKQQNNMVFLHCTSDHFSPKKMTKSAIRQLERGLWQHYGALNFYYEETEQEYHITMLILDDTNEEQKILFDWLPRTKKLKEQVNRLTEEAAILEQIYQERFVHIHDQGEYFHELRKLERVMKEYLGKHGEHTLLEVILFLAKRRADENSILLVTRMSQEADALTGSILAESDQIGLFVNLLDNAIEACIKLSGSDNQPVIRLDILELKPPEPSDSEQAVRITLINPKQPFLSPMAENFTTTKPNQEKHGYGMKVIHEIANRYHGTVDTVDTGDSLVTDIILYGTPSSDS